MRRALTLLAAALAVVALPASAAHAATTGPTWHDGEAKAPVGVTFKSVAAYRANEADEDLVLAVGHAAAAGTVPAHAAIYRRVGTAWVEDQLGTAPVPGCLTKVAVTAGAAWAVGTTKDDCSAGNPLAVRYAGGGTELAKAPDPAVTAPLTWSAVDVTSLGTSVPTALALFGTKGYLGDSGAFIRPIDDTAAAPIGAPLDYKPYSTPALKAVNGIAYTSDPATAPDTATPFALAVGNADPAAGPHIFGIAGDGLHAATFQPDTAATPVVDVAGMPGSPLAIEASKLWTPDGPNGSWKRQSPPGANFNGNAIFRAVSSGAGGGKVVTAIVGDINDTGAVWTRTGTGSWSETQSPASVAVPLEDVAVVRPDDIWAVGSGGTVVRYSVVVARDTGPPPCTANCTPPPCATNCAPPPCTTDCPPPPCTADCGPPPTVTVVQQPPASPPKQPAAKKGPTASQSVLRGVRVRVMRGRLLISFRLVAPARVSARALRAGKLVGRSSARLLQAGHGSLVVRFRGAKPPSQLQIIVRPVTGTGNAGGQ